MSGESFGSSFEIRATKRPVPRKSNWTSAAKERSTACNEGLGSKRDCVNEAAGSPALM